MSSRLVTNSLHIMTSVFEDLHIAPEYDGLIYLAESVHNPPILRPHQHVELEVNLVVRGSITYVLESERYTFRQGTLLWFFPWQKHQLVRRSEDAQYFVAVFKPGLVERSCSGGRYDGLRRPGVSATEVLSTDLDIESFEQIQRSMESLMEDALDAATLNREAGFGVNANFSFQHRDPDWLNAGLHQLLLLCWRSQGSYERRGIDVQMHPAVRKALDVLAQQGDEVITMAELAPVCCVSPAYLSRIFRQQVGVTISQYRNSMKLGRFWKIYHGRSQPSLMEASYAAGFGSYAQFFRVFRDAYGQGPREALGA